MKLIAFMLLGIAALLFVKYILIGTDLWNSTLHSTRSEGTTTFSQPITKTVPKIVSKAASTTRVSLSRQKVTV
jgi:hypothetical protein